MSKKRHGKLWKAIFGPRLPKITSIADTLNPKWDFFMNNGKQVSMKRQPLIKPDSKIFCMGSCFALEVKKALRASGYIVHPSEKDPEPGSQGTDFFTALDRQLVYYNTFTMLQEFEKAFGFWKQSDDDFWVVRRGEIDKPTGTVFQDPYRRLVFSESKEGIIGITKSIDAIIKQGILESDVYIFTLGLTEVWKNKKTGRYACADPGYGGGGGHEEAEFVRSQFEDNYANLKKLVELIRQNFPSRNIVITVSPVPLGSTYTSQDVVVANTESKSILRAVAAKVCREFSNVHYFPAYEMCIVFERSKRSDVYENDGRHVMPETVSEIISSFLGAFTTGTKNK